MKIDKQDMLSINRVAMILDISDHTITRWYKWWENDAFPKPDDLYLPPYYYLDRRLTKYFKKSDINALREFKNKIQTSHRGYMADFNSVYQWGKRGKKLLENRGVDIKEIKDRMK